MTYLLANYMVYGFMTFPEDLKDRFIIEVFTIVGNNLKAKGSQKLGIQACFALVLSQCMAANLHEFLTRSQVQDIAISAVQCIQTNKRSEVVLTAAISTINACLVYSPKITIETLQQRNFFLKFVSTLSKKLITVCQTPYDRKLLSLSLVSMLRHTAGVEGFARMRHAEIFKFVVLLMDYHLLLLSSNEGVDSMSLEDHTRYGNRQKDIMYLQLIAKAEHPDDDVIDELDLDENMREEDGEEINRAAWNENSSGDNSFNEKDSLYASDDSADFKNYDFDVSWHSIRIDITSF